MSAEMERQDEHVEPHVLQRLELCLRLGTSPSAIVWKVIEKRTRRVITLKKCFDVFSSLQENHKAELARSTYREVMYLVAFSGHDGVVQLQHLIKADNGLDLYLTFDYHASDLLAVIRARVLTELQVKYVVYQLLRALKFVHSAGVVHRDVKPSNILVDANCNVKLADFGSARALDVGTRNLETPKLTDYVSTRWYRAVECLLGSTQYTEAVDMWALGCVYAEMLTGEPLFPGTSTMDQVQRIVELLGVPRAEDVAACGSAYAATMLDMLSPLRPRSMLEALPEAAPEAVALISLILTVNPASRCTVLDAIRHPYVAEFHDDHDEPTLSGGRLVLPLDDYVLHAPGVYRDAIDATIRKRKQAARATEKHAMTNPAKTALLDHEETLPEPF